MIVEDKQIVVKDYSKKALSLNGWVSIGRTGQIIRAEEDMKKGVSNYTINIQKQLDKVISLNQKLRCSHIYLKAEEPVEIDFIQYLSIDPTTYETYANYSFNKICWLTLKNLDSSQNKEIISKVKQINSLIINSHLIPNLKLHLSRINHIRFENATFLENIRLPAKLRVLEVSHSNNIHFLAARKVDHIRLILKNSSSNVSLEWLKNFRRVKIIDINVKLSKCVNYLDSRVRWMHFRFEIDEKNIDLAKMKKRLPFLINISARIPIQMAQTLNLRRINPIMSETEEKYTLRPREVVVTNSNAQELNKHPELFEKAEKVLICTSIFNFDCLASKID